MALHTMCADADSGKEGGTEGSALCLERLPQPLLGPVPSSSQAQPDGSFLCHVVAVEWLIEKCSETQGLVQRGHQRLTAIRVENYEKNMRRLPVPALWCSTGFVSVWVLPGHYCQVCKEKGWQLRHVGSTQSASRQNIFPLTSQLSVMSKWSL